MDGETNITPDNPTPTHPKKEGYTGKKKATFKTNPKKRINLITLMETPTQENQQTYTPDLTPSPLLTSQNTLG